MPPDALHFLGNSVASKGIAIHFIEGVSLIDIIWGKHSKVVDLLLDHTSLYC